MAEFLSSEGTQKLIELVKGGIDEAKQAASDADAKADTATTKAEAADAKAVTAGEKADAADAKAETANTTAEAAQTTAEQASTTAKNAEKVAGEAKTTAESAVDTANKASEKAKELQGNVDTNTTDLTALKTQVGNLQTEIETKEPTAISNEQIDTWWNAA